MTEKLFEFIQNDIGIQHLRPTVILASDPLEVAYEIELVEKMVSTTAKSFQMVVRNSGQAPLVIRGLRWVSAARSSCDKTLTFPAKHEPRYFATENYRNDFFTVGSGMGECLVSALENRRLTLGMTEDQLFPGIYFMSSHEDLGFLLAQSTQNRLHALYRLTGRFAPDHYMFEIEEKPTGLDQMVIGPGQSLKGEEFFMSFNETRDPQLATAEYYSYLRQSGCFDRCRENPLESERIYCSWNYDFFKDVSEEAMLAQLPIIKEHLPMVKFIQLDDGYQRNLKDGHHPTMLDQVYETDEPWDKEKFPSGPKGYADKVRAQGFRPAIWYGLWASKASKMYRDHPDWVLRDDSGREMTNEQWGGGVYILDPSVAGVQEYLHHFCRTVFSEWGYEGVKLDFSTFAFNAKRVRFRAQGKTAVELRHMVEGIFRQYLPKDGFFGWCVVAGTGHPFMSQADYYRCALDIGKGEWHIIKEIAKWLTNTLSLYNEWSCLPNIDSMGWSEEFDDTRWQTWLNLFAISGMGVEISGDLRKLSVDRLKKMSRSLELSDPSRKLRILDYPFGVMEHPPSLWLSSRDGEPEYLAVFNWSDEKSNIEIDEHANGVISGKLIDVWSDVEAYSEVPLRISLEPRQSLLLKITK